MTEAKFGYYTLVNGEQEKRSKDHKVMVLVECSCGKREYKRKSHLLSGRCVSCKSCSCKRTATHSKPPVNRKGCEGLSGTHYNSIKSGAKKRGLEFSVSPEYLWGMYDGKCSLTGESISLIPAIKNTNVDWSKITASLDRIDNTKGYVEGNVWWVHKDVNRLKNNYPLDVLYKWCELLLRKRDRQS